MTWAFGLLDKQAKGVLEYTQFHALFKNIRPGISPSSTKVILSSRIYRCVWHGFHFAHSIPSVPTNCFDFFRLTTWIQFLYEIAATYKSSESSPPKLDVIDFLHLREILQVHIYEQSQTKSATIHRLCSITNTKAWQMVSVVFHVGNFFILILRANGTTPECLFSFVVISSYLASFVVYCRCLFIYLF